MRRKYFCRVLTVVNIQATVGTMTDIDKPLAAIEPVPPVSPCAPLNYVRGVIAEAIIAPDHYLDVVALACALTHKIDDVFTAPRILALGKKGSGKSTLLTVASYLAANAGPVTGVKAMTGPSYVAEYRANEHWTGTLDEVNHLFGESGSNAKQNAFYTYLNQGYKRDTASAQHTENKVPLRIPIFGVVFLAGQGKACPEDLRDRSVILQIVKAPRDAVIADFSDETVRDKFIYAGSCLATWCKRMPALSTAAVRELKLHPKLVQRNMEVWGPLVAMALAADGGVPGIWTDKAVTAFAYIELDGSEPVHTPEVQLLLDYSAYALGTNGAAGIASGAFAQFAMARQHEAYAWMRPGQFRQFATRTLGPTVPYYDDAARRTVRGWNGDVHQMNLDNAQREIDALAQDAIEADALEIWEDF